MTRFYLLLMLLAFCPPAFSQSNTVTLTNNEGKVYANVVVIKIENDGILLRLSDNAGWDRIKFTNMSKPLQIQFGYDPERAKQLERERQAIERAEREKRIAAAKAAQYDSIKEHLYLIRPILESDFPTNKSAQDSCREIVSELKGIRKAIELGINFSKFSDLLTDKVLAVEKIKDLHRDEIPYVFSRRVGDCVDSYKESKHWWSEEISSEYGKSLCNRFMRNYWTQADLYCTYCTGIAEKDTNANSLAIILVAGIISDEQAAVKDGLLKREDYFDPNVAALSVDQIVERLNAAISKGDAASDRKTP